MTEQQPTTQAAEPVDATAPAPSQAETESIYAWSEHNDDDTAFIQRRSWKIPVTLAVLATAAAVTTGVVMMWPAQTTPLPAQTPNVAAAPSVVAPPPAAAPPPPTLDEQYLARLKAAGLSFDGDPSVPIRSAHETCEYIQAGHTRSETLNHFRTPSLDPAMLATAIDIAAITYCPNS